MAHFAELDQNNIVKRVIVVDNSDILDENGQESEIQGINFCTRLLGGRWIQTSYNANIRRNYAGVGYTYDEVEDAFVAPQPYASWTLNSELVWVPPVPYPDDVENSYEWDEEKQEWVLNYMPV